MSYEGHIQCICDNGHYFEKDCYDKHDLCPTCHEKIAWCNDVDDTNCESYGIIPYEIMEEKYRIAPPVVEVCNLGHAHEKSPSIFRIPNHEEAYRLRHYCNILNGYKLELIEAPIHER